MHHLSFLFHHLLTTSLASFSSGAAFDQYNKSRLQFVQTVADLASRPQNMEHLHDNNVMSLLHPLLMDAVPAVQQTAALALGKLASFSQQLAQTLVSSNILPQLISQVPVQNVSQKRMAAVRVGEGTGIYVRGRLWDNDNGIMIMGLSTVGD